MSYKHKLISLTCSGESFEKAITLYYFSKMSNFSFYDDYNVCLFYGHNLPKKNKYLSVHGTVGFYSEYLSNIHFLQFCKKEAIISQKNTIISLMLNNGLISYRNAEKIEKSKNDFWKFVKFMPLEYLYPEFCNELIRKSQDLLCLYKVENLYTEKNIVSDILSIDNSKQIYNIYSLDISGNIGRFFLNCSNKKKQAHLITDLQKKTVLSGNSAYFIKTIENRVLTKTIVGYREHNSYPRPNRNLALNSFLSKKDQNIIEPKIIKMGYYFDTSSSNDLEYTSNIAYANAYAAFLNDNKFSLNL